MRRQAAYETFEPPDDAWFWDAYNRLPEEVRVRADRAFEVLQADPYHPSLRLKKVGGLGRQESIEISAFSPRKAAMASFGSGSDLMMNTKVCSARRKALSCSQVGQDWDLPIAGFEAQHHFTEGDEVEGGGRRWALGLLDCAFLRVGGWGFWPTRARR